MRQRPGTPSGPGGRTWWCSTSTCPGARVIGVLEALRAENPRPTTIVLTNDPTPQWREACLRIGADHFFDKTAEFQQAIDVIARLAALPRPS